MSEHQNDPRYINPDRVKKLAFLFRREIAKHLEKDEACLDLWASILSAALRGDDETNESSRSCIDMLIEHFHPDKQQRRDAAQRSLDGLEFGYDSEIKKAEFVGDLNAAKRMRQQISETRALMEKRVGNLKRRQTIEPPS